MRLLGNPRCQERLRERVLFPLFMQLLDNYDLLSSLTTLEDDCDLVESS